MHQVACSKLRELRDGVNYANKYGIYSHATIFLLNFYPVSSKYL